VYGLPDTSLVAAQPGLARAAMKSNVPRSNVQHDLVSRLKIRRAPPVLSPIAQRGAQATAILDQGRHMRGPDIASHTVTSRDHDIGKGAVEDDRPIDGTNAPGLDDDGLPNDLMAIAEDGLGARADGSQG